MLLAPPYFRTPMACPIEVDGAWRRKRAETAACPLLLDSRPYILSRQEHVTSPFSKADSLFRISLWKNYARRPPLGSASIVKSSERPAQPFSWLTLILVFPSEINGTSRDPPWKITTFGARISFRGVLLLGEARVLYCMLDPKVPLNID